MHLIEAGAHETRDADAKQAACRIVLASSRFEGGNEAFGPEAAIDSAEAGYYDRPSHDPPRDHRDPRARRGGDDRRLANDRPATAAGRSWS